MQNDRLKIAVGDWLNFQWSYVHPHHLQVKTMTNSSLKLVAFFLLICCTTNGHRILGLFPHPGLSHFHFFHPVMKGLAEAGHEVTVVSHFPNKEPIENYKDEALKGKHDGLQNFMNLEVSLKIDCCWIFSVKIDIISCSGSQVLNLTIIC